MTLSAPVPILRIFDEAKARAFYTDFLGFRVDWEHRFGDDFPLYLQIARDDCVLHLSEHHGDGCPGAALRVPCADVVAFHAEVTAKGYRYAKPGLTTTPWRTREMQVSDPSGNRLTFFCPLAA